MRRGGGRVVDVGQDVVVTPLLLGAVHVVAIARRAVWGRERGGERGRQRYSFNEEQTKFKESIVFSYSFPSPLELTLRPQRSRGKSTLLLRMGGVCAESREREG